MTRRETTEAEVASLHRTNRDAVNAIKDIVKYDFDLGQSIYGSFDTIEALQKKRASLYAENAALKADLAEARLAVNQMAAERGGDRARVKEMQEAISPVIRKYSVANWSDQPDGQMTGKRISHGTMRALCRAARVLKGQDEPSTTGGRDGGYPSARAPIADDTEMPARPEALQMVIRDNQRMRQAGTKLAEAALYTIREHDGLHRLSLAVAEWAQALADEGDRGERHKAPSPPPQEHHHDRDEADEV